MTHYRRKRWIDLGIEEAHDIPVGPDRRAGNTAAMIVLTDGRNNPEPVSSAVARRLAGEGRRHPRFTVGLGDAVAMEARRAMVSSPDGYVFAPSAEELAAILQ